jgi:hypothetical protein
MTTVAVAVEAMRHDAAVWDEVSGVVGRAGQEAAALTLGEAQLSWASVPTGLLDTYQEIQRKVAALLGEGRDVTRGLSVTLDEVATAYQLSDDKAAARFDGEWDVHE